MDSKKIAKLALAGAVSLGTLASSTELFANTTATNPNVKCYGVAAASKNDCGTVVSACAASIAQAGACYAWVYLPKGICEKIVGASVGKPAETCKGPNGQPALPPSSLKTTNEKNA